MGLRRCGLSNIVGMDGVLREDDCIKMEATLYSKSQFIMYCSVPRWPARILDNWISETQFCLQELKQAETLPYRLRPFASLAFATASSIIKLIFYGSSRVGKLPFSKQCCQ